MIVLRLYLDTWEATLYLGEKSSHIPKEHYRFKCFIKRFSRAFRDNQLYIRMLKTNLTIDYKNRLHNYNSRIQYVHLLTWNQRN